MNTVELKCVTIIAEVILEKRLTEEVTRLGATGYTVTDARGKGSRGLRTSEWEGQNIVLQTLVGPAVAERILQRMAEAYFPHFAAVAYVENVQVVRGEKYL